MIRNQISNLADSPNSGIQDAYAPSGNSATGERDGRTLRLAGMVILEIVAGPKPHRGGYTCSAIAAESCTVRSGIPILSMNPSGAPNWPALPEDTQAGLNLATDDSADAGERIYGLFANMRGSNGVSLICLGITGQFSWAHNEPIRRDTHVGPLGEGGSRSRRGVFPYLHTLDWSDGRHLRGNVMSRMIIRGDVNAVDGDGEPLNIEGDGDLFLWVSEQDPPTYMRSLAVWPLADGSGALEDYFESLHPRASLDKSQSKFRINLVGDIAALRIARTQRVPDTYDPANDQYDARQAGAADSIVAGHGSNDSLKADGEGGKPTWGFDDHQRGVPWDISHDMYNGAFEPADERLILGGAFTHNYMSATLMPYLEMLGNSVYELTMGFRRIGALLNRALATENDVRHAASSAVSPLGESWHYGSIDQMIKDKKVPNSKFAQRFTIKAQGEKVDILGADAAATGTAVSGLSIESTHAASSAVTTCLGTFNAAGAGKFTAKDPQLEFVTPRVESVKYLYALLWEMGSILGGFTPRGDNAKSGVSAGVGYGVRSHIKPLGKNATPANPILKLKREASEKLNPVVPTVNAAFALWRNECKKFAPVAANYLRASWNLDQVVYTTAGGTDVKLGDPLGRLKRMHLHPDYQSHAHKEWLDITPDLFAASGTSKHAEELAQKVYLTNAPYPWWEKCLSPIVHMSPITMDPQESTSLYKFPTSSGYGLAQPDRHWRQPRPSIIDDEKMGDSGRWRDGVFDANDKLL